mmetsp:Transcript_6495/g.29301  ORF Transcript_6495/g.29301 Transcript_6495/m.29301 type:complete len:215 (-) Transcript_6495:38-682(-)
MRTIGRRMTRMTRMNRARTSGSSPGARQLNLNEVFLIVSESSHHACLKDTPRSVSIFTSSPLFFSAIVSSHPPICAPPMNTFGTVRWPVIRASADTNAFSSLNLSRSTARCATSMSSNSAFISSQYGHQLLAHTTTSLSSIFFVISPVSLCISSSETSTSALFFPDVALVATRWASVGARRGTARTWSARTRARRDAMRVAFIASAGAANADMC